MVKVDSDYKNLNSPNKRIKYIYKPVSIPGGGFVTGFVFHPSSADILYCRTDIGGIYRYDFDNNSWKSLIDHAADPEMWETYPLSIALDKNNPSYIYSMVGNNLKNKIGFSSDYGESWTYYDAPIGDNKGNTLYIHGNAPSRSTGERLVVDPNNSNILYMGTMKNGLWKTEDRCRTWIKLDVSYGQNKSENNISFVDIDPMCKVYEGSDHCVKSNRIIVATSGEQGSPDGNIRGQSVYISNDCGKTFLPLEGEPAPVIGGSEDHPGYVGQRAAFCGKYIFITYAAYNIGWSSFDTYGCDLGRCFDGAVYRFELDKNGKVIESLDVTPDNIRKSDTKNVYGRRLGVGMSGICADNNNEGTLICSTICSSPNTDTIYRTTDYGVTWKPIMRGLDIGIMDFNVSYEKPEYNGGISLVHWMSDLKINPFDSNMALFNTGAGIFMTKDLTKADKDNDVTWSCCDKGVEETVHLNIYSPPSGEVKLLDIVGDYGGFIFKNLDEPAENTFADKNNDRWITAMNADYPDSNPNIIVTAPRGNWTGRTKGGIILSLDQGNSWEQLKDPYGISHDIDKSIDHIKMPNVTAGWTAISADGKTILWSIGDPLYSSRLVYTDDMGRTWNKSNVLDISGNLISEEKIPLKIMADRVNSEVFYGFSDNTNGNGFYVSRDKGRTFMEVRHVEDFPKVNMAGIDSRQEYEIRVESYNEGVVWIALNEKGLWKMTYDYVNNYFDGKRVSREGEYIKRIGIGKGREGSSMKTLYTSGYINGEYGFYRSHDEGAAWIRINDDKHQYGDIRSICGDMRVFGRVYVATGTRGIVYGEAEDKEQEF